jgi:hypothetical protein
MTQIAYVRLKPYDPKIGNVRESFRMGAACGWGDLEFREGQVMELDAAAAQWLADNIYMVDYNPGTPKAFDIWHSKEELAKTLRAERMQKLGHPMTAQKTLKISRPPVPQYAEISHADTPALVSAYEAELAAEESAGSASGDLSPATASSRIVTEEEVGGVAADYSDRDVGPSAGAFSDMEPSDDDLVAAALDTGEAPEPEQPPKPKAKKPAAKPARKKPAAKPPKKG